MSLKIFVSYARVDKHLLITPLVDILSSRGYDPWFDHDLIPGKSWKTQLFEAIHRCDVFIYAMTPESIASDWCLWELNQAAALGKPILTVRLQANIQMPQKLRDIQWVDFTEGITSHAVAKLFRGLANAAAIPLPQLPEVPGEPEGLPSRAPSAPVVKQLAGTIEQPDMGASVSQQILASGTIEGLPDGWHLYLVVEIGNLIWPKEPEITVNGETWSVTVYEGGKIGNHFNLSLYAMDEEGHQQLRRWMDHGNRTGDFPGLDKINNSRRLSTVSLQRPF